MSFLNQLTGDKFEVEQIIEKYNNRVIVNGAVYRPGTFSISEMTVKDLVEKAGGLKADVYLKRPMLQELIKIIQQLLSH